MPELPEVETVMRGLTPVMQGRVIREVWCGAKGLRRPFAEGLALRLAGARVMKLSRRAKYILLHLRRDPVHLCEMQGDGAICYAADHILALHLGMSGRIRIAPPGAKEPSETHDHFFMTLETGHRIILNDARRFGMVFDLSAAALADHPSFARLGAEPFSAAFNGSYLQQKFSGKTGVLKPALMDQRVVVGVGNIYACEALFRAGLSPLRPARSVSEPEIDTLISAITETLTEAIQAGGSTLKDHRLPDGNFGYFQQKLAVYGRAGATCLRCAAPILRIEQAGRSTFYCAQCQK